MDRGPITVEAVRARAELAGVTIDAGKLDDIAYSMEQALAPLRGLDSRANRLLEPATAFRAGGRE